MSRAIGLSLSVALVFASLCGAEVSSLKRQVALFDFEEAKFNNLESLPRHWYVIGRRPDTSDPNFSRQPLHQELARLTGYPHFTEVRFDRPQQEAGNHALLLKLSGGNAGAYVAVGTLPVVPGGDYLVTARVRTDGLRHARAVLRAYFVNAAGERLEQSQRQSEPMRTDGRWQELAVKLPGDDEAASWLGMQLELLQPERSPRSPLGGQQVLLQDVSGQALFDDVAVWQLPRVSLRTDSEVNIVRQPRQVSLRMDVRDLTGHRMRAQTVVYDHRLREVARTEQEVGGGLPTSWRWNPPLRGAGWYLADLRVRGETGGAVVARAVCSLLWLGPAQATESSEGSRFWLDASGVPREELAFLPQMLEALKLRGAVVSAFDPQSDLQELSRSGGALERVVQEVLAGGNSVELNLAPLPVELAQGLNLDPDKPFGMFAHRPGDWEPYLAPVMLRFGQRVSRWRLGEARSGDAFFFEQYPRMLATAAHHAQQLAPQPRLLVPWRVQQSPRSDGASAAVGFALHVPEGVTPAALPEHLHAWRQRSDGTSAPEAELVLDLALPSATNMSHASRIDHLAQRMIYAWSAGVWGLSVPSPWTRSDDRQLSLLPDPLLGVFAVVSQQLSGRRVTDWLPLSPGLRCAILEGPSGGMLALWSDGASPEQAVMHEYLGPSPVMVDVWGERRPVPLVQGKHRVQATSTPIFIEGIDAKLALFRAAFKLDDPFIESRQTPHERTLTIRNPWSRTISGSMLVVGPENWRISPTKHFFSIASGRSSTVPVTLSFPVSEVTGPKKFTVRMDFIADEHYVVDLSTEMQLGLRDIGFDASVGSESNPQGGLDAVVTSLVTNRSNRPVSLYAFASMPGQPRQERIIARLLPGQTTVRRFRFTGAGSDEVLRTTPLRAGLRETAGPAMANVLLTDGS